MSPASLSSPEARDADTEPAAQTTHASMPAKSTLPVQPSSGLGLYISPEQERANEAPHGVSDEPNVSAVLNDVMHWDVHAPLPASEARPPSFSRREDIVQSTSHVRIISSATPARQQPVEPVRDEAMTSTLSMAEAPTQATQRSIPIELSDYARPSQTETSASDATRRGPRSLKEDAVELPRPEAPAKVVPPASVPRTANISRTSRTSRSTPHGAAPAVKGAYVSGNSPPLGYPTTTVTRSLPPVTITSPETEARQTLTREPSEHRDVSTKEPAPEPRIPASEPRAEAPASAEPPPTFGSATAVPDRGAPGRFLPEPLRHSSVVYGYTGEAWDELLDMEVATAYVMRITARIRALGVDEPQLLSSMAVDLSASETRRLIRAVVATLRSPTAEADKAFDEELQFAHVLSLVALLKWVLARIGTVTAVRSGSETLVMRQEHGFVPWMTYTSWRAQEGKDGFSTLSYLLLIQRLEKRTARLLDAVMDFLALVATHSAQNHMTPSKVGRYFGMLLFGAPEDASFAETYAAFVRASNATEHILLAFMRYHVSMAKARTYLPRRLLRLVDDYPRMLSPDLDAASGAVRTVPATYVAHHVREYSHDLMDRRAWPDVLEGFDFAHDTCKMLNIVPYRARRPRTEVPTELADSYVSTLMQRWNEFSFDGFDDLDTTFLSFDLRESDRRQRLQRPESVPWFQFEERGFHQNADDNTQWDWVMRLDEPSGQAPVLVQHEGGMPRSSSHVFQGEELPFPYTTEPLLADTVMDELFPEVWADYLVGNGWSNRDERVHRDASFAVLQLTRDSPAWYVLEEVVPQSYRDTLDQMGRTRRHSIPMLRKLNQFRMVRAGQAPESTVSVEFHFTSDTDAVPTSFPAPQAPQRDEAGAVEAPQPPEYDESGTIEASQPPEHGEAGAAWASHIGGQAPAQPEPATYERGRGSREGEAHRQAGLAEHPTPTPVHGSQARQASEPPPGAPWQNECPPPTPPKRAELPSRPAPKAPASEAPPGDRPKMGKLRRILSSMGSPRHHQDGTSPRTLWSPIFHSPPLDGRASPPQDKPGLAHTIRKRSSQWILRGRKSMRGMRPSSQDETRTSSAAEQPPIRGDAPPLATAPPASSPPTDALAPSEPISTYSPSVVDHGPFSQPRSRHSSPVVPSPDMQRSSEGRRPATMVIPRKQTPAITPEQMATMDATSADALEADARENQPDEPTSNPPDAQQAPSLTHEDVPTVPLQDAVVDELQETPDLFETHEPRDAPTPVLHKPLVAQVTPVTREPPVVQEPSVAHIDYAAQAPPSASAKLPPAVPGAMSSPPIVEPASFATSHTSPASSMPNPWASSVTRRPSRTSPRDAEPAMSWTMSPVASGRPSSSVASHLTSPDSPDMFDDAHSQLETPPLPSAELSAPQPRTDRAGDEYVLGDIAEETDADAQAPADPEPLGFSAEEPILRHDALGAMYLQATDDAAITESTHAAFQDADEPPPQYALKATEPVMPMPASRNPFTRHSDMHRTWASREGPATVESVGASTSTHEAQLPSQELLHQAPAEPTETRQEPQPGMVERPADVLFDKAPDEPVLRHAESEPLHTTEEARGEPRAAEPPVNDAETPMTIGQEAPRTVESTEREETASKGGEATTNDTTPSMPASQPAPVSLSYTGSKSDEASSAVPTSRIRLVSTEPVSRNLSTSHLAAQQSSARSHTVWRESAPLYEPTSVAGSVAKSPSATEPPKLAGFSRPSFSVEDVILPKSQSTMSASKARSARGSDEFNDTASLQHTVSEKRAQSGANTIARAKASQHAPGTNPPGYAPA